MLSAEYLTYFQSANVVINFLTHSATKPFPNATEFFHPIINFSIQTVAIFMQELLPHQRYQSSVRRNRAAASQ